MVITRVIISKSGRSISHLTTSVSILHKALHEENLRKQYEEDIQIRIKDIRSKFPCNPIDIGIYSGLFS